MNSTAAAMLGLLSQIGPINGNSLSRCADVLIGDYWTLTRSQVYRELQTLEGLGFINAGPTGARSSREFSLTPEGLVALTDWLNVGPADEVIRFPMLLTIRFGGSLPLGRLRELLRDFETRHRAKREFYVKLESDMRAARNDPFEIATVRFGQLFEAAIASWLDELPELLPSVFTEEPRNHQ
jgi:DNA-binding PadR family transcriptional regulator